MVHQIEDAILNGEFGPGEKLPSEKELMSILDVSRGTLRESMRALEQKGLVEIKPGAKGGIYVRELNSDQMIQSLGIFIRSQRVTLSELSQFREDLEGLITARAAESCGTQDAKGLKELLRQALTMKERGLSHWPQFMQADQSIHMAIAKIAANPLHYFFMETVHSFFNAPNVRAYLPRNGEVMDRTYDSLAAIINAVETGDRQGAQAQAKEHVRIFFSYMARAAQAARVVG